MPAALPFDRTTRLVARGLGISGGDLLAGLRPATPADLASVIALRNSERGGPALWDDEAYLPWRYRLGRREAGFGDLWLVEIEGELLAMVGTEDMSCTLNGKHLDGLHTMDLLIHPKARSAGLGAWLNQAMFERGEFVVAVGANDNSRGIVQRLFEPLTPMRTYTHPMVSRTFVNRPGLGAWPLVPLTGCIDLTMKAWRRTARWFASSRLDVRPLERFSDDTLQTRCDSPAFRSEPTDLNRRLFDNPRVNYRAVGAYEGTKRVGHLAWRIGTHPQRGRELTVADLRAGGPNRPAIIGTLLLRALTEAAALQCAAVRLLLQERGLERLLMRYGFFHPRRQVTHIVGLHARDPTLQAALLAAPWAMTECVDDNDGF